MNHAAGLYIVQVVCRLSSAWSLWGLVSTHAVYIYIGCPLRHETGTYRPSSLYNCRLSCAWSPWRHEPCRLVSIVFLVCIYTGCPVRGHRGDTSHAAGLYCPSSLYNCRLSSAWSPWGHKPCSWSLLSKQSV